MLWAAFTLGFFGFLQSGEFTCQSTEKFNPLMLAPKDVQVDSRMNPYYMTIQLKCSKTDPFCQGTTVVVGAMGNPLCPVTAMLAYLACRPAVPGPLFLFASGETLSRERLVQELKQAVGTTGLDTAGFSGHSFRIGAATSAAAAGINDSLIQTLGRWRSSTFRTYIRTSKERVAAVTKILARTPHRSRPHQS